MIRRGADAPVSVKLRADPVSGAVQL